MSTDASETASAGAHRPPTVELVLRPSCPAGYAAVVVLCGEHDLASEAEIAAAFAPIAGNLLVDLSRCEFIDSTVISVMVEKLHELRREGHRLELVVPPENVQVVRVLQVLGIATLLTIHDRLPSDVPATIDEPSADRDPRVLNPGQR